MEFKDYDFFAWMEAEKLPEAPCIKHVKLKWYYIVAILGAFLVFYSHGLAN